ncbi:hypothetical protein NPIL_468081 [Nephila pilipes]|uniref:Uncharacterized protein n=1 Tax=Nephila pilipes TaxID=299642 RepID=A0A8X6TR42_NEPPI|nr:hypothetical protein NPIL_468081 [Nephila pilipes]
MSYARCREDIMPRYRGRRWQAIETTQHARRQRSEGVAAHDHARPAPMSDSRQYAAYAEGEGKNAVGICCQDTVYTTNTPQTMVRHMPPPRSQRIALRYQRYTMSRLPTMLPSPVANASLSRCCQTSYHTSHVIA